MTACGRTRARRVAYDGLGLAGVGVALSFVGSFDPAVGVAAMLTGFAIALAAAVFGASDAQRRNRVGEWWLEFWQGEGGRWVERLAAAGLERQALLKAPEPERLNPETASGEVRLSESGVQDVKAWLKTHKFETDERASRSHGRE